MNRPSVGEYIGKRGLCNAGFVQIFGICAGGMEVHVAIEADTFSFEVPGIPEIDPRTGCTAEGRIVTCQRPKEENAEEQCPTGGMLTISPLGYGLTLFGGVVGAAFGGEVGIAIPTEFFFKR